MTLIGTIGQVRLLFHWSHVKMLPINLLGGSQDVKIEGGAE
jgi:hypothetical protein